MSALTLQWTFVEFEHYMAAEDECSEMSFAVATEFASFRTRVFATRAQVRALASALREWSLSDDGPQARWGGTQGRGGVDIRFGFKPPGQVAVLLRLQRRSSDTPFGSLADHLGLCLLSEPILIDGFADQLMEMAEWRTCSAELRIADRLS